MTLINAKNNNKAASLPPNEEMLVNLIFPVLSHFTVYFSLCLLYRYNTALKKHSQCKSLVILLMARGSGFFYALPTLIFSVFTGEFRFNEAVNITRSQKLCYSESFTIFPSNLELLSLNDCQLVFPSMHSCFQEVMQKTTLVSEFYQLFISLFTVTAASHHVLKN